MAELIELRNLGEYGVISDLADHSLEAEAFSNADNVRFDKRGPERFAGHADAFGAMSVAPEFIFNVPSPDASYWIYCSLTKAYVYESGVHTNITRQDEDPADVDYTPTLGRRWQGTILGGIPILNNGSDVPQFWDEFNVATRLQDLTNWPSTLRARIVRAFGPYLIALNLDDDGTLLPKTIQWSHKTDPGAIPSSWDYTSTTVDAGRLQLTDDKGGEIRDAVILGSQLIIYTSDSTHTLRYVGGTAIFSPDLLFKDSGLLAPRCACTFNKGTRQFAVSQDDIIVHAGTKEFESVVEDKVKERIFTEIDETNYLNSFVFENPVNKEIWFCYPTQGNEYPNQALVWNYKTGVSTFRDAPFNSADSGSATDSSLTAWDDLSGSWNNLDVGWSTESRKIVVAVNRDDELAYKLDTGYAFGSNTPIAFVERTGLAIDGMDRNTRKPTTSLHSRKLMLRIWPKISGGVPVQVRVGSQQYLEGPVTWSNPHTFDPTTMKWLDLIEEDFACEGLLLAYRIESQANEFWRLEGIDFEIVKTGIL